MTQNHQDHEVIEPELKDIVIDADGDTAKNKVDRFHYLAYNGIKSIKQIENNRVKMQKELSGCTFTPKIN